MPPEPATNPANTAEPDNTPEADSDAGHKFSAALDQIQQTSTSRPQVVTVGATKVMITRSPNTWRLAPMNDRTRAVRVRPGSEKTYRITGKPPGGEPSTITETQSLTAALSAALHAIVHNDPNNGPDPNGGPTSSTRTGTDITTNTDDSERELVLHYSRDHGVVLYGTQKSDNIGQAFRNYTDRTGSRSGQWRHSYRINNGIDDQGAWFIRGSKDHHATDTTVARLGSAIQALTDAHFQVRLELHEPSLDERRLSSLRRQAQWRDVPVTTIDDTTTPQPTSPSTEADRSNGLLQRSHAVALTAQSAGSGTPRPGGPATADPTTLTDGPSHGLDLQP